MRRVLHLQVGTTTATTRNGSRNASAHVDVHRRLVEDDTEDTVVVVVVAGRRSSVGFPTSEGSTTEEIGQIHLQFRSLDFVEGDCSGQNGPRRAGDDLKEGL